MAPSLDTIEKVQDVRGSYAHGVRGVVIFLSCSPELLLGGANKLMAAKQRIAYVRACSELLGYSDLRDRSGSTPSARCAGMRPAAIVTSTTPAATATSVTGSFAAT